MFRNKLGENIFRNKYAETQDTTWAQHSHTLVDRVCGDLLGHERFELIEAARNMKFMAGGRYQYYAGGNRKAKFWNNCYLLRAEEDTREEWAALAQRATSCLMVGGGIGVDYSRIRGHGRTLKRTGGISSGPIPLMAILNEIGRNVMQGGSRRSALYASLNWQHSDVWKFLEAKNWSEDVRRLKEQDFNFPAPLDMTNVSVNYDDAWLNSDGRENNSVFLKNVKQALKTGEPGFSFNFGEKQNETLRNACCEVTSEDDSDVCNLGSINIGRIEDIREFAEVVELGTKFLMCGSVKAELPYDRVYQVRERNRRLGLGLMGVHEWLLKRNSKYEVTPELKKWLEVYRDVSRETANKFADQLGVSRPVAVRAIAPTGTIGMLAGTTTGIEPLYSVAYKRRYLTDGTRWNYEFTVDAVAEVLINECGITNPDDIETALDLSNDIERRLAFQADVQAYVDQAISSTVNLPAWGTAGNNADKVPQLAGTIAKYAPRLRGLTFYPDNGRGGQPITKVSYAEAIKHRDVVFVEHDSCKEGVCGL